MTLTKATVGGLFLLANFHFVALGLGQTATAAQEVWVTAESPIVADEHCVVQRFYLDLPKGTPEGFVTLKLSGHDGGGCVYPSAKEQARRIEVNVVTIIASGRCALHVNFLSKTRLQELSVADNAKTGDLVHLSTEGGGHALEEDISLGEFNGFPLLLAISPKACQNANAAPSGH